MSKRALNAADVTVTKRGPNAVDVTVGRNIRFYRLAAKLSQEALGAEVGVTFQQVQKYEKGRNRVGASRLNQIGKALGIPVIRLFDGVTSGSDASPGKKSPAELIAEPHAFRLAAAFADIANVELRLSIIQLVEQIARDHKPGR